LKYLAPYIFRVAISNKRIVKLVDGQVTFSYKAADTGQTKYCTLSAEKFIQRFLEHVLPKGFMKVRYYGYFSPGNRPLLHQVRRLLAATEPAQPTDAQPAELALQERTLPCPQCGQPMRLVETVRPARYRPP
jgi:hypothetical protein